MEPASNSQFNNIQFNQATGVVSYSYVQGGSEKTVENTLPLKEFLKLYERVAAAHLDLSNDITSLAMKISEPNANIPPRTKAKVADTFNGIFKTNLKKKSDKPEDHANTIAALRGRLTLGVDPQKILLELQEYGSSNQSISQLPAYADLMKLIIEKTMGKAETLIQKDPIKAINMLHFALDSIERLPTDHSNKLAVQLQKLSQKIRNDPDLSDRRKIQAQKKLYSLAKLANKNAGNDQKVLLGSVGRHAALAIMKDLVQNTPRSKFFGIKFDPNNLPESIQARFNALNSLLEDELLLGTTNFSAARSPDDSQRAREYYDDIRSIITMIQDHPALLHTEGSDAIKKFLSISDNFLQRTTNLDSGITKGERLELQSALLAVGVNAKVSADIFAKLKQPIANMDSFEGVTASQLNAILDNTFPAVNYRPSDATNPEITLFRRKIETERGQLNEQFNGIVAGNATPLEKATALRALMDSPFLSLDVRTEETEGLTPARLAAAYLNQFRLAQTNCINNYGEGFQELQTEYAEWQKLLRNENKANDTLTLAGLGALGYAANPPAEEVANAKATLRSPPPLLVLNPGAKTLPRYESANPLHALRKSREGKAFLRHSFMETILPALQKQFKGTRLTSENIQKFYESTQAFIDSDGKNLSPSEKKALKGLDSTAKAYGKMLLKKENPTANELTTALKFLGGHALPKANGMLFWGDRFTLGLDLLRKHGAILARAPDGLDLIKTFIAVGFNAGHPNMTMRAIAAMGRQIPGLTFPALFKAEVQGIRLPKPLLKRLVIAEYDRLRKGSQEDRDYTAIGNLLEMLNSVDDATIPAKERASMGMNLLVQIKDENTNLRRDIVSKARFRLDRFARKQIETFLNTHEGSDIARVVTIGASLPKPSQNLISFPDLKTNLMQLKTKINNADSHYEFPQNAGFTQKQMGDMTDEELFLSLIEECVRFRPDLTDAQAEDLQNLLVGDPAFALKLNADQNIKYASVLDYIRRARLPVA